MALFSPQDDIVLRAKITGANAIINQITGEKMIVRYFDDHVKMDFTQKQKDMIQEYLRNALRAKPGRVRIGVLPVITPPLLQTYGKFAIGFLLAAFLLGKRL